jgi:phage pi2 protein 07
MINVYFLETQYSYLGWHDIFLELVLHLKEKHNANIIHQFGGHLNLEKFGGYQMPDCEILIEDTEKDTLKGITFAEWRTGMLDIFEKRSNPNDVLLQTQFYNWFHKDFDRNSFKFQLKGTPFYTFTPSTNHEFFYHKRKFKKFDELIDKVFFLFSTHRQDGITLRDRGIVSDSPGPLHINDYLSKAIDYKMGLAAPSLAELCYREIEYLAVGLPMLRLEYMTQLNPPLIPNYHYIAVDRSQFPWDANADRNGGPEYVEAYIKRFNETKDDKEFLEFIAKNGREYYTNYCSPQNKLKHILNLLNLD